MYIFHKRPLSLILCIMLGGFVLYTNTPEAYAPYLFIIPAVILILPLFFRSKRVFCLISAICLASAMLSSALYFGLWFDAGERFNGEVDIRATVEVISYDDPYNSLTVKASQVNGEMLSGYRFLLSTPRDETDHLTAGDIIEFKATISSLADNCSDDVCRTLISRGVNGFATATDKISLISSGDGTYESVTAQMRENIRRHAVMLSDEETGTLVAALLLGERDYLSPKLTLDFRRIGLSHVLALSGMHLAILSYAISRLLSLLGIGKRTSTLISMLFSLGYMAFTGFPLSVVRAAVMLSVASLMTLFSRTRDPITGLSVAVFIILIATPYAVYDISLWLSAMATFGLVSYTSHKEAQKPAPREPYAAKAKGRLYKVLIRMLLNLLKAIVTSMLAIGATLLITSTFFEAISVISPFTTLLFSPIIEVIMYLGLLMLALGSFIPVGRIIAPLVQLTAWLASKLSSINNIYVSTDYFAVEIAICIFTVFLILFLILKIKHKKTAIAVLSTTMLTVFVIAYGANYEDHSNAVTVLYADSDSTKMLIQDEDSKFFISSGLHSEGSAYTSVNLLSGAHISELDGYYVTHYSYALPKELEVLFTYVTVDRIYLPAPENSAERDLEKLATSVTERFEIETVFYNTSGSIKVGQISLDPIYRVIYGEGSVKCAFSIFVDGKRTLYFSSGMLDSETYATVIDELDGSDTLIFGMHGRKYKSETIIGERITPPERIIILSENLDLRAYDELYYESVGTVITKRTDETFCEVIPR